MSVQLLVLTQLGMEVSMVRPTRDYEKARGRAEAKYGFFIHVVVFTAVMLLLVVINLITSPGTIWFIWPLLGWGLAIALHVMRVFLMADRDAVIDSLTERELRSSGSDTHRNSAE